jgi:hypothetical protein
MAVPWAWERWCSILDAFENDQALSREDTEFLHGVAAAYFLTVLRAAPAKQAVKELHHAAGMIAGAIQAAREAQRDGLVAHLDARLATTGTKLSEKFIGAISQGRCGSSKSKFGFWLSPVSAGLIEALAASPSGRGLKADERARIIGAVLGKADRTVHRRKRKTRADTTGSPGVTKKL